MTPVVDKMSCPLNPLDNSNNNNNNNSNVLLDAEHTAILPNAV